MPDAGFDATLSAPRTFRTTRWSIVRSATQGDGEESRQAMQQLCQAYWYPLYAFVRRSGWDREDAEDLVQDFFIKLFDGEILAAADPGKGKLRNFLLGCLRHHMLNAYAKSTALKRGEGQVLSLDAEWAEKRYASEPVDNLTPDRLFQRRWALTVLEHSLKSLAEEHAARGKSDLFAALRPFLGFKVEPLPPYELTAAQLGMPVGTLKSHVSRLRQGWREVLFEQVASTLGGCSPDEIRDELIELMDGL